MSFSPPYTPVLVDPTTKGSTQVGFFGNQANRPVKFGSNFYQFLYDETNSIAYVAKSTSGAGGPFSEIAHDATSFFSLGYQCNVVGNVMYAVFLNNTSGGLQFYSFDTSTETFTGPYGHASSPHITPEIFYVRPSDSHHIVCCTNQPNATIVPSFYEYDPVGVTWSGLPDGTTLATNVSNVSNYTANGDVGVCQSNGVGHIFFTYLNTDTHIHLFYQQLLANSTLGHFHDFGPGQLTSGIVNTVLQPLLDETNGNVIVALVDEHDNPNVIFMLSGTPLSNPVFTSTTTIDTIPLHPNGFSGQGQLTLQGGILYLVVTDGSQNLVFLYANTNVTTPLVGWTTRQTIFNAALTTITGWVQQDINSPQIISGSLFLFWNQLDPTSTFEAAFTLGGALAPVGPGLGVSQPTFPATIALPDPCCHHLVTKEYDNIYYSAWEDLRFDE